MSLILNIETATTVCSVSLSNDGTLLAWEELDNGYTHAENLHVFIRKIMLEARLLPADLSAVAVSRGPGSYTGLRIGTSTAKGFAYALGIPLISVDTLLIMSHMAASRAKEDVFYCPMIDARRMEVYTALYNSELKEVSGPEALVVDQETALRFRGKSVCYFGDGMQKCRQLLELSAGATFLDDIRPSARFMPVISHQKLQLGKTENVVLFEPFYLKDFIAGKKKTGKDSTAAGL